MELRVRATEMRIKMAQALCMMCVMRVEDDGYYVHE